MPPVQSSTVFARYPAALSLPTADPNGLAVEVMLRFANVRVSRRDCRLGDLSLTIHDPSPTAASSKQQQPTEVIRGLQPCLERLSSEEAVAQLSAADATEALCVRVLTEQCIFPAFLFATHFDPAMYRACMAKSVEPKVAFFWEGITGSYRAHALRANPFLYTGRPVAAIPSGQLSVEQVLKLKEVAEAVDKAFSALESLYVKKTAAAAGEAFFMGTSKPTYVDALVYAAASSFFHADVGAAPLHKARQRRLSEACPHLLRYTERRRQQYFEADSGTYCLKLSPPAEEDAAVAAAEQAEQQFRKGRLRTLVWTGAFASFYFVLANSDVIAAMLLYLVEGMEEMGDAAAEASARMRADLEAEEARRAGDSSTPREPREL